MRAARPDGAPHEFAEGELESLFDSLQSATPEDVIRFPGMAMIEE